MLGRPTLPGTEALCPTTLQELKPAHNHISLEVDPSSVEPADKTCSGQHLECSLVKDPESRRCSKAVLRFLTYRNCVIVGVCCFELLSFGMIT